MSGAKVTVQYLVPQVQVLYLTHLWLKRNERNKALQTLKNAKLSQQRFWQRELDLKVSVENLQIGCGLLFESSWFAHSHGRAWSFADCDCHPS